MNHAYTRAGGVWTSLTDLLASELADLDAKTVDSLSATGGTYSLTSDMVIGNAPGATWTFNTPVSCFDDFTGWGTSQFVNGLDVYGHFTSAALADFYGDTTFRAATAFEVAATFNDFLTCNGDLNAYSDLNAYGNLVSWTQAFLQDITVAGDAAFTGPVAFNAGGVEIFTQLTLGGGPVVFAHDGRMTERTQFGLNADTNYSIANGNHVHFKAGTLSANRIAKIVDSGTDGDYMRFTNHGTTGGWYVTVQDPSGVVLAFLTYATAGDHFACVVKRIDGVWTVIDSGERHLP